MTLTIVIPAYQSAEHLPRCLAALMASTRAPEEILLVDDGSTDGGADVARAAGIRVIAVPDGPRGPAAARNRGAAAATGDILVFLDADVAVHADTIARLGEYLEAHPDVEAVFATYDATPAHPAMVSQYRNLLHHFVHQESRTDASTFWAACGAIRRDVFLSSGGFDERYLRPAIEDIELGVRLRDAGRRIALRPEIQATHLKHWTLAGILRSDIFDRAIPWTRLILDRGTIPNDLNLSWRSRFGAVAAWVMVGAFSAALFEPAALGLALSGLAAMVGLNHRLYSFMYARRGVAFAGLAVGLHGAYLLYSSGIFGAMTVADWITRILVRPRGAGIPRHLHAQIHHPSDARAAGHRDRRRSSRTHGGP